MKNGRGIFIQAELHAAARSGGTAQVQGKSPGLLRGPLRTVLTSHRRTERGTLKRVVGPWPS